MAQAERPYYYWEVILGFSLWGVQDLFAFPWRGKAKEKLLGSKNLFSKSCSERRYYYTQVISVFRFGKSKLASLAFVGNAALASAPGATRLVFSLFSFFSFLFLRRDLFSLKEYSDQETYLAKVDHSAQ